MNTTQPFAPALSPHRVLVIDDNRDVADSCGELFRLYCAEVSVVYSGADGLLACETFKPSAVVLDLNMPVMDGYETARRIRDLPGGADIFITALSGWGVESNDENAASLFDHHLIKPMSLHSLQALLKLLDG